MLPLVLRLPYPYIFGGVSAIKSEQFSELNGYSNWFWGWGGEDDDMSSRIRNSGRKITRYSQSIARYKMLKHRKAQPNPRRFEILRTGKNRFSSDGLNSVQYKILNKIEFRFFTWFNVELESDVIL